MREVFGPCLKRFVSRNLCLCRVENTLNVLVVMSLCVFCSVGDVRVPGLALICLSCSLIKLRCMYRRTCRAVRIPRHHKLTVVLELETPSMCIKEQVQGRERTKQ